MKSDTLFMNISTDRNECKGAVIETKENYYLLDSFGEKFYIYEKNNTKEVGFGLAFNGSSCHVVANYYPGGNFNRQEKNNVFPENIEKEKLEEIERKRKEEKEEIKFTPKNCNLELFNELEIKKHNELRKKHHVGDLIINKELMKIAQKHADKMAKTNNFSHSNKKDRELKDHKGEWVGENIYYFWTSGNKRRQKCKIS